MKGYVEINGAIFETTVETKGLQATSADSGTASASAVKLSEIAKNTRTIDETIAQVLTSVRGSLKGPNRPTELEIEFGIKIEGKFGLPMVTQSGGEASIRVKAIWKGPPPAPPPLPSDAKTG